MRSRCEAGAVLPLPYAADAASRDSQPQIRSGIKVECLSVARFRSAKGGETETRGSVVCVSVGRPAEWIHLFICFVQKHEIPDSSVWFERSGQRKQGGVIAIPEPEPRSGQIPEQKQHKFYQKKERIKK